MTCKNHLLLLIVCVGIPISFRFALAQDAEIADGTATIRGDVVDTSPEQKPIAGVQVTITNSRTGETYTVTTDEIGAYVKTGLPAGRYTISVSKEGYGDRAGKSKVATAGGEIYDQIKMRKMETIFTFLLGNLFTLQFVIGFGLGILFGLLLSSLRSRT
jgi:hypothetical protein